MLDPAFLKAFKERATVEIADQKAELRAEVNSIKEEMGARGLGPSGLTLRRIGEACASAARRRPERVWAILRDYAVMTGVTYSDDLEEDLKRLVAEHVPNPPRDLVETIRENAKLLRRSNVADRMEAELASRRSKGLGVVFSEIAIFTLSLKGSPQRPDAESPPSPLTEVEHDGSASSPHVFVSYIRDDRESVARLASSLKERGISVWLDREQIMPGQRWKDAIRRAIRDGAYFIACFSPAYLTRDQTYMNEELTLAVEQLRQRPTDRAWFIPVVLPGGEVPDRQINGGESLRDLQWIELHDGNWDDGVAAILKVVNV